MIIKNKLTGETLDIPFQNLEKSLLKSFRMPLKVIVKHS